MLKFCYALGLTIAITAAAAVSPAMPRNVILVIVDGMGYDHVMAARIQNLGIDGRLHLEQFPVSGSMSTHALGSDYITDSAASGTAMATGHKTTNERIAMLPDGTPVPTLFHTLQPYGFALGVVTNGGLNGATAAAFTAQADSRDDKASIARQMLAFAPDFLLGTTDEFFFADHPSPADLGFDTFLNLPTAEIVIGDSPVLIGYDAMIDEVASLTAQSNVPGPNAPSLVTAFDLARQKLTRDERPFFLLFEEDWTDSWGHDNEAKLIADAVYQLDLAVAVIRAFAETDGETLVIVTADHECGGLTLTGADAHGFTAHFSTEDHTAAPVPLFAFGPGAHHFAGSLDNTDIHRILSDLLLPTGPAGATHE